MSTTTVSPSGQTVCRYLGDLIAVHTHVGEAVARHAKDERVFRIANGRAVMERADAVLKKHLEELEAYAKTSGGVGAMGMIKEAITSMTGFVTGLYGTIRGEAASRMFRDDYTGISFVMICTQMLHTTARAVGEVTISAMLLRHMEELAEVIMEINGVLPYAVMADLGTDGEPIMNPHAGEEAAREQTQAWKFASHVNK
jgi:hypothetical protein